MMKHNSYDPSIVSQIEIYRTYPHYVDGRDGPRTKTMNDCMNFLKPQNDAVRMKLFRLSLDIGEDKIEQCHDF